MEPPYRLIAGISLAILAAGLCSGQEPRLKTLSLADARKIALTQNWDILAAKSGIETAEAQKVIARQFPNPTVSLSVAKINVDGTSNSYEQPLTPGQNLMQSLAPPSRVVAVTPARKNGFWDRTYDTIVAVSQLFELGGKRKHRLEAAKAGVEAAKAQFDDAGRILDSAVIKAYGDVLLALTNVHILQESAASMREEAQLAGVRENAGDISSTDRLQIEVEADRLDADARAALATAAQARVTLTTLLGLAVPNADWEPIEELDALAGLAAPGGADEARGRPDLLAAKAMVKKADAELLGQKALKIPDPTVSLNYEHEPPDGPNSIGVGVSVPLPAWHRYGGEVKTAEIARDDAQRDVRRVNAQIDAERSQARIAYAAALERWNNYKTNVQPKSIQIRENVSFAYRKGGMSLLDLLSTQRTCNAARMETAQSAADTLSALTDLCAAFNTTLATEKEVTK